MIKRAQGSMNERKQRGRKRSKPSEKGNSFPYCSQYPTLHCKVLQLCAISGMMAMLDLGGRDPLGWVCCPTRFQECVIFHFLLTGNHRGRQRWPPRRGERRASLSGGAALKEFRDSSALWRPITPSSLRSSSFQPSDNARQASAIDLPGWLPRNELMSSASQRSKSRRIIHSLSTFTSYASR